MFRACKVLRCAAYLSAQMAASARQTLGHTDITSAAKIINARWAAGLVGVLVCMSCFFAPDLVGSSKRHVKLTPRERQVIPDPDEQRPLQTLGFELPDLPGEEFRFVIPELISDAIEPIQPWEQAPAPWDIGKDIARCHLEIPSKVRTEVEIRFLGERIEAVVRATNLSRRTWQNANAFICFAYYAAPSFYDPNLERTFVPVGSQWKTLATLFSDASPGPGRFTFFAVAGGPSLNDLWVSREIPQRYAQVLSQGRACVISTDRRWIAGVTTPRPAYVFNNRVHSCIHADPLMGSVPPGTTAEGGMTVYIFRGTIGDFERRCEREVREGVNKGHAGPS